MLPASPQSQRSAQQATRPPNPSPSVVSSSDAGEREERRAALLQEGYWDSFDSPDEEDAGPGAPQTAHLDASLKASRLSPRPSNARLSPSPARALSPPAPSSSQHRFVARSPPLLDTSRTTSPHHRLPHPSHHPGLPSQSSSDDEVELVAPERRSSTRSPEPASSPVVIPPEEPAGRSFRNRTAAQLNPYSIEQAKYTRSLLRNGWQGAVVAGPRRGEESTEDLQRRKLAAAQAPKDDLGGWLEYEEDQVVGGRASSAPPEMISDDSEDGLDLLAREALRKSKLAREVDAAFRGGPSRPSHNDTITSRQPRNTSTVRRVPSKAKQGRSHQASRRAYSSDTEHGSSQKRDRSSRGNDAAPTSSPHAVALDHRDKSRHIAAPSKSFHAHSRPNAHRSTLDARILEISSPSSSSPRRASLNLTLSDSDDDSMDGEEHDDELEEDNEPEEMVAERAKARLNLQGKRKRALGMMMPAVFMKKAQADLRLMEREKKDGVASGSDMGSGDEDAGSDGEEGPSRRQNRAKIYTVQRMRDQPLVLDGEAFTDESGDEDGRHMSPVTSEDEGDAVSSWLHSFAPQRQKASDEDIVDRFLSRSRGRSKSASTTRRPVKRQSGGQPAKKKLKDGHRPQLHEKQNTLHSASAAHTASAPNRSDGATVSKRPSVFTKAIPLDTDAALFQAAARVTDRTISRPLFPHPPLPPPADDNRAIDNERWAWFGKFSDDFGIARLPVGARFAPHSLVSRGHLFSLLHTPLRPSPPRFTTALGVHLSSLSTSTEVVATLSILCDAIFDHLSQSNDAELAEPARDDGALGEALGFLGNYITEVMSEKEEAERSRFADTLRSQLERLQTRLDALAPSTLALQHLNLQRIGVSWYMVDLAARLFTISPSGDSSRVSKQAAILVRRLLRHGINHTTKTLKSLSDEEPVCLLVDDISVDAWLGLVSLALHSSGEEAVFCESDLWRVVVDETLATLSTSAMHGPIAGEVLSYTTMVLCAISQFSPVGMSTSSPRLPAHWAIATRVLGPIDPIALSRSDHTLSNTAIARRDRYLSILFSRYLVFVERWEWRLDGREDLLPKLFDLLNARRLADLSVESVSDFPCFLQDLRQFDHSPLDRESDTAFTTFLKLIIHATSNIPVKSEADRRRQVTRLFLRLSPIISSSWTRRSPELAGSASALINHYSLYMAFTMLSPSSAPQRLDQARRLLAFGEVDEEARRTCIRAVLYFAFVFQHHNLSLIPIIDWLASIAEQLRTEYVDIERQRRREERTRAGTTTRGGRKGKEDALWHRAVLLTMVLRSVQLIMRGSRSDSAAYPDLGLLHPAWTSQLLDSPLALDPMIGSEVVKTIASFLDVRRRALPHRAVEELAGESQDDFGMFDMDFEDPALDALLGVERDGPAEAPQDQLKVKEQAFAQLIKTNLSPAFFRLVSNILTPDHTERGGPTVGDRSAYAQQIVECWTRCLTVMIENDVVEWSGYLRYGDHSWKRISDPLGRRDIGLLLAIQILSHDSTVFPLFRDEFLEIWFQSIVARKLTAQNSLTSALLNVDRVSPLLETLPFDRNEETGRFAIEKDEFELRRLDALAASFRQIAKLLAPRDITAASSSIPKASLLNLLRGMLTAMKDNLSAIPDELTRRQYAAFCRGVLEALRKSGSAELNDQSLPDMRVLATATAVQVTTIPSRLARLTQSSGSWPVAQQRARSLYRQWYRAAPEITQLYAINFPASAIRAKVRQEFERNSLVDDLETVDILLLKGHQEFQETVNCWKMESQLMRWFANEELPARPDNFLDAFYLSRDETRAVQPTA